MAWVSRRTIGLSNFRTIEPSDYQTFRLSNLRSIDMEPFLTLFVILAVFELWKRSWGVGILRQKFRWTGME